MNGVNGPMSGTNMETISVIHSTWETWKIIYPESEVLTANTGFQRNYEGYAYGKDYLKEDSLPVMMKDQEGNYWDIFGYAVEGPRKGTRLKQTNSYTGYWFAFADFFPALEIYQDK